MKSKNQIEFLRESASNLQKSNEFKGLAVIVLAIALEKQIKNVEAKIYFLKGLADSIKSIDANEQLILNFRYYYKDDIESMEKVLQQHALHELFFKSANKDKIERLSRTLNIQWAIDIENSIRKN